MPTTKVRGPPTRSPSVQATGILEERRRFSIIELQRAFDTEEYSYEEERGICRQPFHAESVLAQAVTDGRTDMGHACRACMEFLHRRNPECFPSIEEYEEFLRRYPEPMQDADAFDDADHQASWLWRAPA